MLSKSTLSIYRKCWKNFTANRLNDLTPAYQRLHYRHLCAIFNWGIKEGLVKENPFRSLPKAPVPHVSYYTPKEVKAILAGLPDTRLGDAIHLFFLTGMRLVNWWTLNRKRPG
jgi:integrase